MAVTGTGINTDPYVIHDYYELKEVTTTMKDQDITVYMTLGNDVDCSTYGPDWQWETITLRGGFDFNLNGFTIKNVTVKKDNDFIATGNGVGSVKRIYNGKILNIYTAENANHIISSHPSKRIDLENVSMSAAWLKTKYSSSCMCSVNVKNCAIYFTVDTSKSNSGFFEMTSFSYSDIYLDVSNLSTTCALFPDGDTISDCRIRGTLKGARPQYLIKSMVRDSVIEIDATETIGFTDPHTTFYNTVERTVINNDLMPVGHDQVIKATTAQIRDGAWLNANGFEVVEVV